MKTLTTTLLATLMLFAISCTKESNQILHPDILIKNSSDQLANNVNVTDDSTPRKIRIGGQVWMTKNLHVTHYRNGDEIPQVKNNHEWSKLKTGAWCWYNDDPIVGHTYGRLYNWYAVNDPRGLAPEGWHVPSDDEWTTLTDYLGGVGEAGGKMKTTGTIEAGTGLWYAPNTDATNISGFTGLPGGFRDYSFPCFSFDLGRYGYLWTSTEVTHRFAITRILYYDYGELVRSYAYKQHGYSVRCIKD